MKFDLHKPVTNLNGEALRQPKSGAKPGANGQFADADLEPRSLADIANDALLAPKEGLSGADMAARYKLAIKLNSVSEPVALSTDELSLLKKVAEDVIQSPLLYGQLAACLEINDG